MPTSSQWNVLTTVGFVENDTAEERQIALPIPVDVGLTPSPSLDLEKTADTESRPSSSLKGVKPFHKNLLKLTCDLNNFTSVSEEMPSSSSPRVIVMNEEYEMAKAEVDNQCSINNVVRDRLHALGFRDRLKKTVFGVRNIKKLFPQYKLPAFSEDSQPLETSNKKPFHLMEQPNSLCFYVRGYSVSHKEVMDSIKPLLSLFPGMKIPSIHFFPMKLLCNSMHVENRWVISMDSPESRDRLCGMQVSLKGNNVCLKRYEEILESEKRRANRKTNLLGLANTKI